MTRDTKFIPYLYKRYMVTSIFALLIGTAGQIGNSLIAGRLLGVSALSVVRLISSLYYFFATAGNLLGTGGATVCAALIGKREYEQCGKTVFTVYTAALIFSAASAALCLLNTDFVLAVLGVPEYLKGEAEVYARLTVAGGFFNIGVYLSFNFLRLNGNTIHTIVTFAAMSAVNILLGLFFVTVAEIGIAGIAAATAAGHAVASVLGIILLRGGSLSPKIPELRAVWRMLAGLTRSGSPGAAENLCILLSGMLLNSLLIRTSGTEALAVYGVVGAVSAFSTSVIIGAAGAAAPLIGIFKSEHDTGSIRQALRAAVIWGALFSALISIACLPSSGLIARLFGVGESARAIRVYALCFVPSALNTVAAFLHQSNNKPALSALLTFLRILVFPVSAAAIFVSAGRYEHIWHSFWIAEILTLIATAALHSLLSANKPYVSRLTLIDKEIELRGQSISFSAQKNSDSIMECVRKIKDFCIRNGLSSKRSLLVYLSLEEMLLSICGRSGRDSAEETVSVRLLCLDPDDVTLRIRYKGAKYNPIEYYRTRKRELAVDMEYDDWIGIKMISDTAKSIEYCSTFGVNNLTILL